MSMHKDSRFGFALPTVLIASVVMLTVLAASVSSVVAVRTALKGQYYEQLAKAAGEAGVAYAKACLAKNGNVPLWSDAKPLKPNTDCAGNTLAYTCPGDSQCFVAINDTVRSTFSVGMPTVDVQGKALVIPNNGYVELVRASNGVVWRTYKQPSVQGAVVPDLCSGAASTGLGWQNAVASTIQADISDAAAATTISLASSALPAGQLYFRRDFAVTAAGPYRASVLTTTTGDKVELSIDGAPLLTSQGNLSAGTVNLDIGCHTATARLTNKTLQPKVAQFTAALNALGSTSPIMTTDLGWRVSTGEPVSFSSVDYYADPDVWNNTAVLYANGSGVAITSVSSWTSITGDPYTPVISPSGNGCPSACPAASAAYMRDSKDFYLASATEVTISSLCDDTCYLYVDGQMVTANQVWPTISQQAFTLPAGYHHLGILLYNGGSSGNPAGVAATIVNRSTGTVLTRTDVSWRTTGSWVPNTGDITAYEASFVPSPDEIIDTPSFDVFVVGGGGGGGKGGGGGGGGVIAKSLTLGTGAYSVVIGGGGAGGSSGNGTNGTSTTFSGPGITTITANGGGGGGGITSVALAGSAGASGGGGGMSVSGADSAPGGAGIAGQGNAGGASAAAGCSPAGGGGGAGGPGTPATLALPGVGGAGIGTSITGGVVVYGSGGGAGSWCLGGAAGAENAGSGSTTTGTAGVVNSGGGGGGGGANGGSGGGAGGSGFVAVRFKEGTATVSASGTNGTTYATNTTIVSGQRYTVYRFFANCTFTISALTPS